MKKSLSLLGLLLVISLNAQTSADELAKQLQNPLSSLISVPIQGNFDFGMGSENGSRSLINIQPVIPVSLDDKWNLITRAILPVVSQNDIYGNSGSQFGLGDLSMTAFLSPKESKNGVTWGVGPVILIPTSTDDLLGAGEFGAGPSVVALKQAGGLTYGALVNHVWANHVSNTFLNPFIAKNYKGGYALALNTEMNQNWENESFAGVFMLMGSKVFNVGTQAMSAAIGPRVHYGGGRAGDFGFRAQLTFMFPK